MKFKELKQYYPTIQKLKERIKVQQYNDNIKKEKQEIVNKLNKLFDYELFGYDDFLTPYIIKDSFYYKINLTVLKDLKEVYFDIIETPNNPYMFYGRGYFGNPMFQGFHNNNSCTEEFSISEDGEETTKSMKNNETDDIIKIIENVMNNKKLYEKFKNLIFKYSNLKKKYHEFHFHSIANKLTYDINENLKKIKSTKDFIVYNNKGKVKKSKKINNSFILIAESKDVHISKNQIAIYPTILDN